MRPSGFYPEATPTNSRIRLRVGNSIYISKYIVFKSVNFLIRFLYLSTSFLKVSISLSKQSNKVCHACSARSL
jgi:hypothetical protein